jgi:hypothetical protein
MGEELMALLEGKNKVRLHRLINFSHYCGRTEAQHEEVYLWHAAILALQAALTTCRCLHS